MRSEPRVLPSATFVLIAATIASATLPVRAGEYYVDAVTGNDANAGTSPAEAWRTISHALDVVPNGFPGDNQVVHVAPGTYDAELGETFPLRMRRSLQLVGDEGSDATRIDATGSLGVLVDASCDVSDTAKWNLGPDTLIQGFTLAGGSIGVRIACAFTYSQPTLRDVVCTGAAVAGIQAQAFADGTGVSGQVSPTLDRVRSTLCQTGLDVDSVGDVFGGPTASIVAIDSAFVGNSGRGVDAGAFGAGAGAYLVLTLRRCSMEQNGDDGVFFNPSQGVITATIEDSRITRNGFAGVEALGVSFGSAAVSLIRSTIADNAWTGFLSNVGACTDCGNTTVLDGSILVGNLDDVDVSNLQPETVRYCDIGDGEYAGANGNFSADPLFVDAPAGDYRLSFGSPCAEAGNPATPTGTIDLAGVARPVDGDLDAIEAPDVGALELAPLFLAGAPAIGSTVALETFGPAGGVSLLLAAAGLPVATPISTPFGEFDLNPIAAFPVGVVAVAPGPPASLPMTIPSNPGLVGLSISFQGFTVSGLAIPPAAFTNAIAITFESRASAPTPPVLFEGRAGRPSGGGSLDVRPLLARRFRA